MTRLVLDFTPGDDNRHYAGLVDRHVRDGRKGILIVARNCPLQAPLSMPVKNVPVRSNVRTQEYT